ncbi:phage scaffolding protein [Aerococcus urinaeequi]|uniref:phage scaffolding protein n=1 Tax=Aerococcus urinaeequi TaxID=51665 RepID=UPI000845DFD0|nr:phage scaffolding protein [Aerococcus urinaeequi]
MDFKELVAKHTGEDGKLDTEAFVKELNTEMPKNYVPKSEFNTKNDELKEANKTIDGLKKANTDNEELQKSIDDYKVKAEQAQVELAQTKKDTAIESALRDAGVTDVDYMRFKLGDIEVDKEGNIVDLDNKVKSLKESNPTFFGTNDKSANEPAGYQVVDNGLDKGKPSDPEATATADFEAALGL